MKRVSRYLIKAIGYILYLAGLFLLGELFLFYFWKEPPLTYIYPGNHELYHHVPFAFEKGGMEEFDYRGRHYETEKEANTFRIVFMGDSFTYGVVPHNQTIPVWFDRLLKIKYPGKKFEILNFGYPSYSPVIHEVQYANLIHNLKADLIVYLYDGGDPIDDAIYKRFSEFDAEGRPIAVHSSNWYNRGMRRSVFIRFIQHVAKYIEKRGYHIADAEVVGHRARFLRDPEEIPMYREWLAYSFERLKSMSNEIRNDGTGFVLFQYPWPLYLMDPSEFQKFISTWGDPNWTSPGNNRFSEVTLEFCSKQKLECYDFYPEVIEMEKALNGGSRLKLYNDRDGHFTGFANRRFAEFIISKLEAKLDKPPRTSLEKVDKEINAGAQAR